MPTRAPRAVLGYKMCRWRHSLRCFGEMWTWLCVCPPPPHRGNCQQSRGEKKKWYMTQRSYVRNVSCSQVMNWYDFKVTEVFVSPQEAALVSCIVLLSGTISRFFLQRWHRPAVTAERCREQSTFRFLLVSVVFLLYSSQQEQTQTKRDSVNTKGMQRHFCFI